MRWRPLVVPGLLAGAAFVPGVAELGLEVGELRLRPASALSVALVLAQCLPLVARRRWPGPVLLVVGAAFAAYQVLGYPVTIAGFGLAIALYNAGAHLTRWRRVTMAAASGAYAVMAVVLHLRHSPERLFDFATFFVVLAFCWGAGEWMRARQQRADRQRERSVVEAIGTERARIARELHDVVTHHVTAMVVQSGAAQYLIAADPAKAADGMGEIGATGRRALAELRLLLDVLDNADAGRAPAVGRLPDLIERSRAAGQPVDWSEQGTPAVTGGGVELAVYRVVQEGLTNAMKHAKGRPTTVRVRHEGDGTHIDVITEASATGPVRAGRGLTGLRERVGVFGGTLEIGGTPGGDFTVRAHLPARAES